MARARAVAALSSVLLPGHLAKLVGFRQRRSGRFRLPLHGLPFWALKLRHPTTVEAEGPVHPERTAPGLSSARSSPPAANLPPVKLTWYDGGKRTRLAGQREEDSAWGAAVLFVGAEGMLIADYGRHQIAARGQVRRITSRPEPTIPDSIGHHAEWIRACKTGEPDHLQLRLLGHAGRGGPAGQRRLPGRQEAPVGRGQSQGDQLPRGRPLPSAAYRPGWTL